MTLARRFAALLMSTLFCFLMLPSGSARAQMELAIIDSNPKLFPVGDVDSMDVRVAVWNMTSSPVRAIARVTSHSQNYSYVLLTSDSVTLPVSQVQFFDVRFYNHQSDGRGSATFEVSSAHAYDSITITAYPGDSALFPGGGPKIRNNLRAIWDVVPGTKVCQTNAIQNTNQKDMIITSITSTNPRFVIENVTLPLTIPGGQHQREIDICYAPESSAPSGFRDETKIVFEYIDQQGNVKSSNVSYVATTVSCLMPETDTLLVEPTILGGFVDVKAKLYNMSGSSIDVDRTLSPSSPNYADLTIIDDNFPRTISAGMSEDVWVRFKPTWAGLNIGYINFTTDPACGSIYVLFAGHARDVNGDTAHLELFPTQKESLLMKGEKDAVTRNFYFRNNTSSNIEVQSVALNTGDHFRITSIMPQMPAFTLTPNDEMIVALEFDADENGLYRDSLVIVTEGGISAQVFSIHGLQQAGTADVVTRDAQRVMLEVSPNPARGPVTVRIAGIQHAQFELLDLLGNTIDRASGSQWTLSTSTLANGAYIVRAIGMDASGKPFVESSKLVIE